LYAAAAMDQAQHRALAHTETQSARAEVEAYVTQELLDGEVDRKHRSIMSTILGEDLWHVRSHTTCTLLPIHDLWVPKYVNWCYVIVCTFIYPFVVTNQFSLFDLGYVLQDYCI
jgi:hypothetical protein